MKKSRKARASVQYHNRVARQYDSIYDDAYWEFHDRVTWNAIRPHLPRDLSGRCCDLGCGTGKWGLKLLKTGLLTTFVDHSPAMIERTRENISANAGKATLIVADIVDMPQVPSGAFRLVLAMGDPLSICCDAGRAAGEMFRICVPGGIVVATADNKLAAVDHYLAAGDLDGLETFVKTSRTRWLTADKAEQFELTTFTPSTLRKLFEKAGFEIVGLIGKTILPLRQYRQVLKNPGEIARLLRLEEQLAADASAAAKAGHLQITVRRPV
ncbi:MAG TPA: methyltransferase domain-containing protein [Tepidisphaeraceae bacterium]|nr:methyltransferase domain-containing protein [Tepidisphaeraceae bacterium]